LFVVAIAIIMGTAQMTYICKFRISFFSFPFLSGDCGRRGWYTTAASQRWGPATTVWPNAYAPMYASVTMYEWCATLLYGQGRSGVSCVTEDLVLFIYSVQLGCKVSLAARFICPTSNRHIERCQFRLLSQPGHSIVSATVTSMRCIACSHLLSNII